ncbi:MAG: M56 family metallopeptidase, partial [Angelakisella sp.]
PTVGEGYMVMLDYVESGYVPMHQPDTQSLFLVLSVIWLTVAVLLGLYVLAINWHVRRKAKLIFPLHECDELLAYCKKLVPVWQEVRVCHSSAFASPIVLGSLHPCIILPSGMNFYDRRMLVHIFTHELTHIRRMDFLTKKLALLSLVVHWFNPLVFLCFSLFSRDIEASCDESVLAVLGEEEKVGYADSLLTLFSNTQKSFGASTLAFGETAIKQRVKGAIGYKKLSKRRLALLCTLVITIGAATTTNPLSVSDGYVPRQSKISAAARADFSKTAVELSDALTCGDAKALLQNSRSRDEYYLGLYDGLAQSPIVITGYKLYPQSEETAYCYLKTDSEDKQYTAVMSRSGGRVRLDAVYPSEVFEAIMSVPKDSEQVRFVRNLHRFGIRTGFSQT